MAEVKTLEQLQQENEDLSKKVSDLETELDLTKEVNDELNAKIEELSKAAPATSLGDAGEKAQAAVKPVLPTETFDVEGTKYKFTTPVFVHNGKRVESAKAINDTALLSELVAKGSGVITKA